MNDPETLRRWNAGQTGLHPANPTGRHPDDRRPIPPTERRATAQHLDRIAAHYHASAALATDSLAGLRLALEDARMSVHNRGEALASMLEDAQNHVAAGGMPLADFDDYAQISIDMGTLATIDRLIASMIETLDR